MFIPIIWGNNSNIKAVSIHSVGKCSKCKNVTPFVKVQRIKRSHIFFLTINERIIDESLVCPICEQYYESTPGEIYGHPKIFLEAVEAFQEIYFDEYVKKRPIYFLKKKLENKTSVIIELGEHVFSIIHKRWKENFELEMVLKTSTGEINIEMYEYLLACAESEWLKLMSQQIKMNRRKGLE